MRSPKFHVLVADNDKTVLTKAVQQLAALHPDIEVQCAESVGEAAELVTTNFFNLAFVDLHLNRQSGIAVLRELNIKSPSCQMFVMTRHLEKFAGEVLALLSPTFTLAGLVDKVVGAVDWFGPSVEGPFKEWQRSLVDIEGLDDIVGALQEKADHIDDDLKGVENGLIELRRDREALTREVEHLVLGLFGATGAAVEGSRPRIALRIFRRGFSSSLVVEVVPSLRLPALSHEVEGNRCVIKIGPRPEIRTEAERYDRVVRFGVTLEHRVELLGLAEGDALAAVCYSFAGGNAANVRSLDDLIRDDSSEAWQKVLRQIFAKRASNWYSVRAEVPPLREFFRSELNAPLERSFDLFEAWTEHLARQPNVRKEANRIRVGDNIIIPLPPKAMLASGGLTTPTPGCLVHGDMHGGNIVIDQRGRAYLIDYRNAGMGPRLIDFAALHATLRFAHVELIDVNKRGNTWPEKYDGELIESISRSYFAEQRILGSSAQTRDTRLHKERWMSGVMELGRASRINFKQHECQEAMWTNFAYCLSLFRFVHLEWYRKLRLLTWLGALTTHLSEAD